MKSSASFCRAIALIFSLLSLSSVCRADVIYTLIPQLVGGVAVTGTITTNGSFGILSAADIVGYSISMQMPSNPGQPSETLASPTGAGFLVFGNYLTATASAISWNFAQGVGAEASLYGNSTITQWHLYTNRIDVDFNGIEYASYRNGVEQVALANAVPEPGSLALLGVAFAGLAWQRKRRGKQA
jgi:hypothetical protein